MPGRKDTRTEDEDIGLSFLIVLAVVVLGIPFLVVMSKEAHVPDIKVASMDFTVNWDLLMRIPDHYLIGYDNCLQRNIQASLFYKNLTLGTSSIQRYDNNFKLNSPLRLRVSSSISEEDIGVLIGQNIIKDLRENSEVKFGSRVFLTYCRENSTAVLSYVCDETTLRFDPSSKMKATVLRNSPKCLLT